MKLKNAWKVVRIKRGMTQEQLADKIGKTKDAISKIESDKRETTTKVIAKALVALDCSIEELYPGLETEEETGALAT